ncbi:MAG: S1C family serine protease [Candidatus Saccharimonadales bacterium]
MDKKEQTDTTQIPKDIPTLTSSGVKNQGSVVTTRHRVGKRIVVGAIFLAVIFAVAFFGSWAANQLTMPNYVTNPDSDGNLVVSETEQNISNVVNKVAPAVVSILTRADSPWYTGATTGAGSGMIVSKDGYILTNKHVIEGSKTATVVLSNGMSYKNVPVIGTDPLNDLAFLKIPDAKDLPIIELGDSKTVRVGQQVIAIGNALGQYQNTVTSGIISGLGRPVSAESESGVENLSDLLQTDAAINSGNSGGPLLNMQGQVIGINTAVAADAQNIGFAIPIGAAKGMLSRLVATGKLQRAVVGVQYLPITPEVREEYKLSAEKGDYVTRVGGVANSVAEKAGIKEKDIITKVNGVDVEPGKSTSTLVGEFQPDDEITLTVLRGNEILELKLQLGVFLVD